MSGYTAITLTDLESRLQSMYEGVPFWTPAEAVSGLNNGLRFWNALTGRWKTRAPFQTTPATVTYGLPAGFVFGTRVTWNGLPMTKGSHEDLNSGRRQWYTETTTSGGDVPTRPMVWAPRSLLTLDIWPADAVGHNSLTVDGVMATPILLLPTDTVNLSEADVSVLLGYTLHLLSFKKGGPWFEATRPYFIDFLEAAGAENALLTTSDLYRRVVGRDADSVWLPVRSAPSSVADLAKQLAAARAQGG